MRSSSSPLQVFILPAQVLSCFGIMKFIIPALLLLSNQKNYYYTCHGLQLPAQLRISIPVQVPISTSSNQKVKHKGATITRKKNSRSTLFVDLKKKLDQELLWRVDCKCSFKFNYGHNTSNYYKKVTNRTCPSKMHLGKYIESFIISAFIICATISFQPLSSMAINSNSDSNTLLLTPTTSLQSQPASAMALITDRNTNDNDDDDHSINNNTNFVKNNRSRYWSIINSNNQDEIIAVNEKLMDYTVGTINTMYYDNSGGAFFSPKDLYDRWKVLRKYAKEGIEGVQDMVDTTRTTAVGSMMQNRVKQDNHDNKSYEDDNRQQVFKPQLFIVDGDKVKVKMNHWVTSGIGGIDSDSEDDDGNISILPPHAFDSREDVVQSLKWLVGTLHDPYSKYLTREELQQELNVRDDGFLGLGVIVEGPSGKNTSNMSPHINMNTPPTISNLFVSKARLPKQSNDFTLLNVNSISNLPIVTAVSPNSPGERVGIVVGDRVAAVGSDNFVGLNSNQLTKKFKRYTGAENYFGNPELTIAKPLYKASIDQQVNNEINIDGENEKNRFRRDELIGYKLSRVRLTTISLQSRIISRDGSSNIPEIVPHASAASTGSVEKGGDSIVQWELLTPNESIFRKYFSSFDQEQNSNVNFRSTDRVGYIRLTRFSRLSTAGYVNAIEELEKLGAQSYIIDVRNNYGGVIQESMLTASTLLRDPHTVLCYTLNSRGGFTPHDAEEYIIDTRYPGYLLSSESKDVTMEQVKRDSPNFVSGEGWSPPSAYASIREQRMNRGISRTSSNLFSDKFREVQKPVEELKKLRAQKKLVILMNEGTASAAEVFASALHDNGRTVATIGTKTYGKGLIQHTFPLQDGGGLRLSVAEYLTPALQHVTKVGGANYGETGEYVGGGIKPDLYCPSTQGIPSNVGADICVGMALDAIEEADAKEMEVAMSPDDSPWLVGRHGGSNGGSSRRRILTQGLMKDDF